MFNSQGIYDQLCDEMLCDPLADTPSPQRLVEVGWFDDLTDPNATRLLPIIISGGAR